MIKIKNNFKIIFLFLLLRNYIILTSEECERETPIKQPGSNTMCLLTYCSQNQIKSKECIISNSIIKTQWLNDIILVGEEDFRYTKLITTSNGELIFATSSCPRNKDRIYYGIDINGNPIFNDEYIIKKTIVRNEEKFERYESQIGLVKINGNSNSDKEFIINIGKSRTYAEIFDYIDYENSIIEIDYEQIVNENIKSFFGGSINTIEGGKNYFIFAFINSDDKFCIAKLYFEYDSNGNIKCSKKKNQSYSAQDNRIVTCYSYNEIIICAYFSSNNKLKIIIFDFSLTKLEDKDLSITSDTSLNFHKLIHLSGNIGLFSYFKGTRNDYPSVLIIESKEKSSCTYSITEKDNIKLDYYSFSNSTLLADFIKIREDLVCLSSTIKDKESLIIILINFYNNGEYNIRYYLINIFKLYNHKIMRDIESAIYNNNLVLAFSFCPQATCEEDSDLHYSSLIFFSYPNCSDYNLDIISYLSKEENNELIINLADNITIDNNIFGFVFEGIKINNIDNCGINFISNKTNKSINSGDTLAQNEKLELILTEEEYEIMDCSISYSLFITEPDFDVYNNYPNYILKENDNIEKNVFTKNSYQSKIGYFNVLINQDLTKNCEEEDCELCLKYEISHCLKCQNNFNYINNNKICLKKETDTPSQTDTSSETDTLSSTLNRCSFEEIAKGKCPEIVLTNSELKGMYSYIIDNILTKNSTNENIIITTINVQFQLSSVEAQKSSNIFISSIDLKDFENKLRDVYNISYDDLLIMFKIDIKSENNLNTYVQYELYNPYNLKRLNLSICNKSEIIINIPAELDSETATLFESLSSYGYNLFDSSDPFYNDICTPYTSLNQTDIILDDRKKLIYVKNGNQTLCQNNCSVTNYNSEYKKAICQCSVKVENKEPDLEDANIEFTKDIIADSFFKTLENSNFLVMKCCMLVFNFQFMFKNIGMIIMTIILLISIILILICCFEEKKKINYFIQLIFKQKYFYQNKSSKNKNESISKILKIKEKNNKSNNKILKLNKIYKTEIDIKKKNSKFKNINKNGPPTKKAGKKNNKLNRVKSNSNFENKTKKEGKGSIISNMSSNNFIKKKLVKNLEKNKTEKINYLNDYELNNLDYESAIKKDRRTFFQYYWSLLKKKQLILFTFIPINDYNLYSVKYILFLISFSLSFTINGFFFSDDTMHKIYIDNGKFDFLYQIVQIIYSTLICGVINTLLKCLSLSEKNILEIKNQKNLKKATEKSKHVKNFLRIKFIVFFIMCIILLIFCWLFISCFCLVYINTQIILITDTLISFGLSMLYPFGLNLLPGIFRIPALRTNKKDKKMLYRISLLVALI